MNVFISALLLVASSVGSYNLGLLLAQEKKNLVAVETRRGHQQQHGHPQLEQQQQRQTLLDNQNRASFHENSTAATASSIINSNNIERSQEILETLVQERLKNPPALPIFDQKTMEEDHDNTFDTLQTRRQAMKIRNELLVHPVLLAHEQSEVVAIFLWCYY